MLIFICFSIEIIYIKHQINPQIRVYRPQLYVYKFCRQRCNLITSQKVTFIRELSLDRSENKENKLTLSERHEGN